MFSGRSHFDFESEAVPSIYDAGRITGLGLKKETRSNRLGRDAVHFFGIS